TIHNRLPATRATGLTRLIPTEEPTLELSAEWWTSPMPFSMTIRWPTQLDSALEGAGRICPSMSAGESSAANGSRKRGNRGRLMCRASWALLKGERALLGGLMWQLASAGDP